MGPDVRYPFPMSELTRKEAADLIGVSARTITGWVEGGYLRPIRPEHPWRYTAADVLHAQATVHAGTVLPRWRANPTHAGQRLRALREGAGLTQQQLARQADVTHEQISRLEHGEGAPLPLTVRKLSLALNVAPGQFVDDTPIGLEMLTAKQVAQRLGVTEWRVREWLKQGVLPTTKVGGRWRVPAIAVAELDRSGRLRGRSRRLDPRYRG
jgi:excisionase family DNA binding protein